MGRGLPDDWNSRRRKVYTRDNYTCQNCGQKGGPKGDTELHAHHIVPKSKGGTNRLSNLKTVCKDCHNAIHGNRMAPTAIPKEQKYGSTRGHLWVAVLTVWWTLGLGNLIYAWYNYSKWHNKSANLTEDGGNYIRNLNQNEEKSKIQGFFKNVLQGWKEPYFLGLVNSFRREAIFWFISLNSPALIFGPAYMLFATSVLVLLILPLLYLWRRKHPLSKDKADTS